MFVCLCKGVTDTQIKESIYQGAQSLKDVRKQLGVATQCCKCLPVARSIVDETLENMSSFQLETNTLETETPLFYSA